MTADFFQSNDWTGEYETVNGKETEDKSRMVCQNLSVTGHLQSIRFAFNYTPPTKAGPAIGVWSIVDGGFFDARKEHEESIHVGLEIDYPTDQARKEAIYQLNKDGVQGFLFDYWGTQKELSSKATDSLVEDYRKFLYWSFDKEHLKSCPEMFDGLQYLAAMY